MIMGSTSMGSKVYSIQDYFPIAYQQDHFKCVCVCFFLKWRLILALGANKEGEYITEKCK